MELFVHVQGISPSGNSNKANDAHTQGLIDAYMYFQPLGRDRTGISSYSRTDAGSGEIIVESKVFFTAVSSDWDVAGTPTFPTAFQVNGDL